MMMKIGLIVNPVAGIGGKAGLKGSDGRSIQKQAYAMGFRSEAQERTKVVLDKIKSEENNFILYTAPKSMGEYASIACGIAPVVIGDIKDEDTSSKDTIRIAREMVNYGISLLLFSGGDGTARDILDAIGHKIPVVGIPAGVKIHSAVYAINPTGVAEIVISFLNGNFDTYLAEVMDLDEEAFRYDRVSAKLYGYLRVVNEKRLMQGAKSGTYSEKESLIGIASEVVFNMVEDSIYLIGSGTTPQCVMDRLGLENTLLGVDVVQNKTLLIKDANEAQLFSLLNASNKTAHIVITIIGGQGHIFGRGNQQLSPRIIRMVGRHNIHIIATKAKIAALQNRSFILDTGDRELDEQLAGYYRVIVGYEEYVVYRVDF